MQLLIGILTHSKIQKHRFGGAFLMQNAELREDDILPYDLSILYYLNREGKPLPYED